MSVASIVAMSVSKSPTPIATSIPTQHSSAGSPPTTSLPTQPLSIQLPGRRSSLHRALGRDPGVKFDYYASLSSVRDYVLVDQECVRAEVRSRATAEQADRSVRVYSERGAEAFLPGLSDATLPLAMLYRRVRFGDGNADAAAT